MPFTLGVLVSNNGYGPAVNLQIESSQPTIIENEKGLLVDFKIVASEVGNTGTTPSLTVNFGNIKPLTTVLAKWIMTCSLTGTFSNYSATFTETNPLGKFRCH